MGLMFVTNACCWKTKSLNLSDSILDKDDEGSLRGPTVLKEIRRKAKHVSRTFNDGQKL